MAKTDYKQFRTRNYLAKDFDSLRNQLLNYARLYYPDRIQDFSETSLGGVFLDLAAYAGDIMSFYLDHQYNELDPDTAIETRNIEKLIRNSGVKVTGASPATVDVTVFIEVPVETISNVIVPSPGSLPVIKAGTLFSSNDGIQFYLLSDIDFSKKKSDGITYFADVKVGKKLSNGTPLTFAMAATATCISGYEETESFYLGSFVPFKTITLSRPNITDILSVSDNQGNVYYEVGSLTENVVYKNVLNTAKDSNVISEALKVVPAPYRFITSVSLSNRLTTMILGGGDDSNLEDDVVPDPSDFAISFPYSKTFSRTSINPLQMLKTRTLGVYSTNSQMTVVYRHGGGLSHNSLPNTITTISQLLIEFPLNPSLEIASAIRNSIACTNRTQSTGGEDAPTVDQLKALIPSAKNSQERIVTKEDLLARVYSLPANFGRVFRAAVRPNPNNPLVTQLYVISRTQNSILVQTSDTLKENLRKYLTPYRLVTDAIEVLDSPIVNLQLNFDIIVDPSLNQQLVIQNILRTLIQKFDIKNFSIDQPIVISDIQNLVYNTSGVLSINNIEFKNLHGSINNLSYSDVSYDIKSNLRKGILYPPPGGIFEFRYLDTDIVGRTSL
jgi:hypothetical protein